VFHTGCGLDARRAKTNRKYPCCEELLNLSLFTPSDGLVPSWTVEVCHCGSKVKYPSPSKGDSEVSTDENYPDANIPEYNEWWCDNSERVGKAFLPPPEYNQLKLLSQLETLNNDDLDENVTVHDCRGANDNHGSPTAVASRNQTTKLKDCDDGALITGHLRVQDHFDCIHKEWAVRLHKNLFCFGCPSATKQCSDHPLI
jgi:hypothetical protein